MQSLEIKGLVVDEQGNPISNAMIVLTGDKNTDVYPGYVHGDSCLVYIMGFRGEDNANGKFVINADEYSYSERYYIYVVADGYDIYKKTLKLSGVEYVDLHTITLHQ